MPSSALNFYFGIILSNIHPGAKLRKMEQIYRPDTMATPSSNSIIHVQIL